VVKTGRFHIDLLISLVDGSLVLWDKTDDIYNDRIETKKTRREVFVFKTTLKLYDMLKNALTERNLHLLNTVN